MTTIGEASQRESVGQAELADPVTGLAGILVDREGGKRRAHPACALAVALLDETGSAAGNFGPHLDVGGQGGALVPAPQMGQHGAIMRPVFTEFAAAGSRDRAAGEQLVRCGGVVHVGVIHRADDRQAIELAGEQREMLGNRDAWNTRCESAGTHRGLPRERRASCPRFLAGLGRPT